MENLSLTLNTGSIKVPVINENGRQLGELEFIPTDVAILERYSAVIDALNAASFSDEPTESEIVAFDHLIREQLDVLFNYPVSESLFSQCSPLTVLSNGDLFYENVLVGVAGIIEKIMHERVEKKLAKVRKATAKYHK